MHEPAARLQHYAEGEMREERGEEKRVSQAFFQELVSLSSDCGDVLFSLFEILVHCRNYLQEEQLFMVI